MSEDKTDKQIEILLSFYNGVQGNLDIRHGYPPINMTEAHAKITQLLLEEQIKLLARIHCCDNEPEDGSNPLNVCHQDHIALKYELEAALKEGK